MKDKKLKSHIPVVTVSILYIISIWFLLRGVISVIALFANFKVRMIPTNHIFGNPAFPSIIELVAASIILIVTWILGTKVKIYQHIVWRLLFFFTMFFGITFQYLWNITAPIYSHLVPFLETKAALAHFSDKTIENVLVGDTSNLMLLLMSLPAVAVFLIIIWLSRLFTQHQDEIMEWFKEWEYSSSRLQFFFKSQETEQWPDVILGPEKKTNEMVIQKGRDRTLNNVIIGPIGTGKTSSLILPIINQDLHHMTRMINEFLTVSTLKNYDTEQIKGSYLNGLSIIEPSNDLCQKAFQLVKAHGIPEEAIFYIDPTNPNTKSINPLKGPVGKVAEMVAMVIEGIGENTEFFFEQSQRNHLKYYIYLLKLHDPNFEPTFSDLIRMYNNAQVVHVMHEKLKRTIPEGWDNTQDRDERNHWEIVKSVDEWFNMNLRPVTRRSGPNEYIEVIQTGEFRGQTKYYDAKAEFVVGLRNILDDISSNQLMRRVLFDKSDFDFDKHLEFGGVLLLNTAKGELDNLSNVLGKFVLLALQSAVFRRKPNDSAFHGLIIDEFPDYIYKPFKEFTAQSRKYKVIVTVASQTLSQLADKYGDHYMQTLLGTMRHKMVFGDLTPFDAELFSKQFGEDTKYEESETEQTISPLQDNPSTRMGSSFSKVREARMSPDDLIYQKAFECSVKLVEDNRPIKVRQLTANFIDKDEFQSAVSIVDEEKASYWLQKRNEYIAGNFFVTETIEDGSEQKAIDVIEDMNIENQSDDDNDTVIERNIIVGEKPKDLYPIAQQSQNNRLRRTATAAGEEKLRLDNLSSIIPFPNSSEGQGDKIDDEDSIPNTHDTQGIDISDLEDWDADVTFGGDDKIIATPIHEEFNTEEKSQMEKNCPEVSKLSTESEDLIKELYKDLE